VQPQFVAPLNQQTIKLQQKVKRSAYILKYTGMAFAFAGGMTIAGNMLFLTVADQFSTFYWSDFEG